MNRLDTDRPLTELKTYGITDMDSLLEMVVILSGLKIEIDGIPITKKGKYISRKDIDRCYCVQWQRNKIKWRNNERTYVCRLEAYTIDYDLPYVK